MSRGRAHIKELARRENVSCKVSGMVTEADWKRWSLEGLRPYLNVVVEAFGPRRLVAGSDWPVCLVACGYKQWFDALEEYFVDFSQQERSAIFAETAERVFTGFRETCAIHRAGNRASHVGFDRGLGIRGLRNGD